MEHAKNPRSRSNRLARVVLALVVAGVWMVFGGCQQFVNRGYSPFVRDLDGLSELSITTYPAWFPRETVDIPFLYKKLVSPDSVYFQVFIREAGREAGENPHVDSIRIDTFSYRFGDGPRTVLISDYGDNFWMQGSSEYAHPSLDLSAVPYYPDAVVSIEIAFTLNGESYSFHGDLRAEEQQRTYPLILDRLR